MLQLEKIKFLVEKNKIFFEDKYLCPYNIVSLRQDLWRNVCHESEYILNLNARNM